MTRYHCPGLGLAALLVGALLLHDLPGGAATVACHRDSANCREFECADSQVCCHVEAVGGPGTCFNACCSTAADGAPTAGPPVTAGPVTTTVAEDGDLRSLETSRNILIGSLVLFCSVPLLLCLMWAFNFARASAREHRLQRNLMQLELQLEDLYAMEELYYHGAGLSAADITSTATSLDELRSPQQPVDGEPSGGAVQDNAHRASTLDALQHYLDRPSHEPCPPPDAGDGEGGEGCSICAVALRCPICLGSVRRPTVTRPCLHIFCQGCISQYVDSRGPPRGDRLDLVHPAPRPIKALCPTCQQPILRLLRLKRPRSSRRRAADPQSAESGNADQGVGPAGGAGPPDLAVPDSGTPTSSSAPVVDRVSLSVSPRGATSLEASSLV